MERMEAHKLEPHFIEAFFMTAMKTFGGRVSRREQGRFEVLEVPSVIRYAAVGSGRVLGSYERICFDKKNMTGRGLAPAELICPGHPLLDALVVMLIDRKGLPAQGGSRVCGWHGHRRQAETVAVCGGLHPGWRRKG